MYKAVHSIIYPAIVWPWVLIKGLK